MNAFLPVIEFVGEISEVSRHTTSTGRGFSEILFRDGYHALCISYWGNDGELPSDILPGARVRVLARPSSRQAASGRWFTSVSVEEISIEPAAPTSVPDSTPEPAPAPDQPELPFTPAFSEDSFSDFCRRRLSESGLLF